MREVLGEFILENNLDWKQERKEIIFLLDEKLTKYTDLKYEDKFT